MSNTVRNVLVIGVATVVGLFVGLTGLRRMSPWVTVLILVAIVVYIVRMLSGNQAETKATAAERASALASTPPVGMANVYIYREGFVGRAMGIDVQLDDLVLVQLKSPRFTMVQVMAGNHTLAAGPRGFAATQANAAVTQFSVQEGQTMVFRLEIAMGALKNTIRIVPDDAPSQALAKLATVTMVIPPRATASISSSTV